MNKYLFLTFSFLGVIIVYTVALIMDFRSDDSFWIPVDLIMLGWATYYFSVFSKKAWKN